MENEEQGWKVVSYQEIKVSLAGPNTANAERTGDLSIYLKDGTHYTIKDAILEMNGIVMGGLTLNKLDKTVITDHTNNMEAEIIFDPESKGYISSGMSYLKFWGDKKEPLPRDHFIVNFNQLSNTEDKEKILMSKGKGSWLEELIFEGEQAWKITEPDPFEDWEKNEEEFFLESDTWNR